MTNTTYIVTSGGLVVTSGGFPLTVTLNSAGNIANEAYANHTNPFISSWRKPLSNNTVTMATSPQMVNNLVTGIVNSGYQLGINVQYLFVVPEGQPLVAISGNVGNTGGQAPIPPAAESVSTGGDTPTVVFQPSTDSLWELYALNYDATTQAWSCGNAGYMTNLANATGVFQNGNGVAASEISYGGIMVTQNDIASGSIDHTVGLYLSQNESTQFWPPANNSDYGAPNVAGQVSEGMWFRFPANMTMPSGLTPLAQMLFVAIQNYGCVVHDRAYGSYIPFEAHHSWALNGMSGTDPFTLIENGQPDYSVIGALPIADLVQILPPELGSPTQAAPAAPAISLTPGSGSITVSWNAVASPTPILFYMVQYCATGSTSWSVQYPYATTTSTVLTGLTSGQSYSIQVFAASQNSLNSTGTLTPSVIGSATAL